MSARTVTATDREACDALVDGLRRYGFAVTPDLRNVGSCEYHLSRRAGETLTTMRIALKDWQAPTSGVVILLFNVHPKAARSKGVGTNTVMDLLAWARENDLANEVRATQVSEERSSRFWVRCGFAPVPNSVHGDHVRIEPRVEA